MIKLDSAAMGSFGSPIDMIDVSFVWSSNDHRTSDVLPEPSSLIPFRLCPNYFPIILYIYSPFHAK